MRERIALNDYKEFKRFSNQITPVNFEEKISEFYGTPSPQLHKIKVADREDMRKKMFSADGIREDNIVDLNLDVPICNGNYYRKRRRRRVRNSLGDESPRIRS